jgi:hypothetical protein
MAGLALPRAIGALDADSHATSKRWTFLIQATLRFALLVMASDLWARKTTT